METYFPRGCTSKVLHWPLCAISRCISLNVGYSKILIEPSVHPIATALPEFSQQVSIIDCNGVKSWPKGQHETLTAAPCSRLCFGVSIFPQLSFPSSCLPCWKRNIVRLLSFPIARRVLPSGEYAICHGEPSSRIFWITLDSDAHCQQASELIEQTDGVRPRSKLFGLQNWKNRANLYARGSTPLDQCALYVHHLDLQCSLVPSGDG